MLSLSTHEALFPSVAPTGTLSEIGMGKSGGIEGQVCPFSGSSLGASLGDRVASYLRRRFPVKTAQSVAADSGASIDTVDNWLRGGAPSLKWFVALVGCYGPEFLATVCPGLDWLDEAVIAAEKAEIAREMAALEARRRELGKK